jgi:hypothetical protein
MPNRTDIVVNCICAALMLMALGAVIWAIYYKSRKSMEHLANPTLVREDVRHITSFAMLAIALAASLGAYLALVLKR